MARLPQPLVESICGLAVADPAYLALVSREWFVYARNIASAHAMRAFVIDAAALHQARVSRDALCGLCRQLTLRRAYLRELCIDATGTTAVSTDLWIAVLGPATTVETLDIQAKDVERLGPLLEAVGAGVPT